MAIMKHMRRGLLVTASAIAITGSAYALPGPVDAIWKNTQSSAEQVVAAIGAAAAAPADIIAMANEMVQAAVLLASGNPPVAIKGITAACAAGSDPDAVAADPAGAATLADACEEAAETMNEIDAASVLQAAASIRAAIAGTEVETDVDVDVENPAHDVVDPDDPTPPGPGPSGS